MLQRFIDYCNQQQLLPSGQQLLLAVSGGRDSVCMTHLFYCARISFAIAHCNFHLRPGDCDRDQQFVKTLAQRYGVSFYTVDFDTQAHAAAHGQSLEEAARQLRYDWFASLCRDHGYYAVATAHHRDDSIETFFLNLFRGTGIAGLHGIRPISQLPVPDSHFSIVRPLLCFSRNDIDTYISENQLSYVEDHTNALLDARRNQIRHRLMPLLRELYPSIDDTMAANIERLYGTEILYKEYIEKLRSALVTPYLSLLPDLPFEIHALDLQKLLPAHSPSPPLQPALQASDCSGATLLFELLRPYGFNPSTVTDILASKENGKLFYTSSHVVELHRGKLLVAPQVEPLPGRHPQPGDRVRLKKGSRLLSDYLKDLGLSRIERRHLLLNPPQPHEPVGAVAGFAVVDIDGVTVGSLPVVTLQRSRS